MDPTLLLGLASAASGFMHPKMSKDQRDLLRISKGAASRLYGYGTGVPGSAPDEAAALAQDRAMLGEQQLQQRNQLLGALGANPQLGQLPDFLTNVSSLQAAQQMALGSQHLLNSLAMRRQALGQAAGIAQGSAGLAREDASQSQLPQFLGQIAQSMAYSKAMNRHPSAGGQGVASTQSVPGGPQLNLPGVLTNVGRADASVPAYQWMMPHQGGLIASGNEPGFGTNALANQIRQSSGAGRFVPLETQLRQFVLPSGVRLG